MSDPFSTHTPGLESPAQHGFAVSPNDGTDLASVTRAVFVGVGGALRVTLQSGSTVTFDPVPNGIVLPLRVRRVHATGTSASAIVGLL